MKKKLIILAAAMTFTLSWSITVCAQPASMPDGTMFDAEYYAQTYPDVVAVYGTDPDMLYQHYTQYGKAEGRAATAPTAATEPASTPASTAAIQGNVDSFEEFNYEYYMRANADVLEAVGINPAALYQHYVQNCKTERRLYNSRTKEEVTNELIQKYGLHTWNDFGDWFVYLGTSFDDIPPESYTGDSGYEAQRQAIIDRYMSTGGSVITSAPSKGVGGETLYSDTVYAWFVYIKPVPQGVKDFMLNYGTPGLFYNHGYDSYFDQSEIYWVQN